MNETPTLPMEFSGTMRGHIIAAVNENPRLGEAARLVIENQRASTTYLKREMNLGYNKASALMKQLEQFEVISTVDYKGMRKVLITSMPTEFYGGFFNTGGTSSTSKAVPMKETAEDREVADGVYRVAADELRSFVERYERLEAEKKDIAEQQKEVMAEAKARGYCTRTLKKVVALRKMDPEDIAEQDAILEIYKEAIGL